MRNHCAGLQGLHECLWMQQRRQGNASSHMFGVCMLWGVNWKNEWFVVRCIKCLSMYLDSLVTELGCEPFCDMAYTAPFSTWKLLFWGYRCYRHMPYRYAGQNRGFRYVQCFGSTPVYLIVGIVGLLIHVCWLKHKSTSNALTAPRLTSYKAALVPAKRLPQSTVLWVFRWAMNGHDMYGMTYEAMYGVHI
jgi:hypothetical protein